MLSPSLPNGAAGLEFRPVGHHHGDLVVVRMDVFFHDRPLCTSGAVYTQPTGRAQGSGYPSLLVEFEFNPPGAAPSLSCTGRINRLILAKTRRRQAVRCDALGR